MLSRLSFVGIQITIVFHIKGNLFLKRLSLVKLYFHYLMKIAFLQNPSLSASFKGMALGLFKLFSLKTWLLVWKKCQNILSI